MARKNVPCSGQQLPFGEVAVLGAVALTGGGGCLSAVAVTCNHPGPRMWHSLCGSCRGRMLLGFSSREEQTAAIRAAFRGQP